MRINRTPFKISQERHSSSISEYLTVGARPGKAKCLGVFGVAKHKYGRGYTYRIIKADSPSVKPYFLVEFTRVDSDIERWILCCGDGIYCDCELGKHGEPLILYQGTPSPLMVVNSNWWYDTLYSNYIAEIERSIKEWCA